MASGGGWSLPPERVERGAVVADVEVAIVGAGLAGSAAAWALSRRGRSVALVEQFASGHDRGSSHGSARIVRRAYGDALYTRLTGEAFELWREVESESGVALLRMLGGLDFGPHRDVPAVAAHLAAAGVVHEVLPTAEAARRWPGMEFEGDVVYHPQAGTLDAEAAVATMIALARSAGADVHFGRPATAITPEGGVSFGDGSRLTADVVVVAAGGWVAALAGSLVNLPPLRVTQQQVFHFPRRDPTAPPWPSVIHETVGAQVYHLAGGRDGGPLDHRKIGEHDGGVSCTADDRTGMVDAAGRDRVIRYLERWLPGLDPQIASETTCLYTETPTQDFILDRVGSVILCSPCSGHGAKFAPLVGEYVAGLVDGSRTVPERFRLAWHASGRVGSVSL